jgi:hypothetical protein
MMVQREEVNGPPEVFVICNFMKTAQNGEAECGGLRLAESEPNKQQ